MHIEAMVGSDEEGQDCGLANNHFEVINSDESQERQTQPAKHDITEEESEVESEYDSEIQNQNHCDMSELSSSQSSTACSIASESTSDADSAVGREQGDGLLEF